MKRTVVLAWLTVAFAGMNLGCMSRMISEGMGTVTGAAGKVVDIKSGAMLTSYKGLKVESVTAAAGLPAPADLAGFLRAELSEAAAKKGLRAGGEPSLKLTAEVVHYETGGIVDEAIGPLQEVIVRTKLTDAKSGNIVSEANLVGRSKATTSGGPENLAKGVGKALDKWLEQQGLKNMEAAK